MKNILEIKQLVNKTGDKTILKGLDFSMNLGEIHVIMGPNGGGKSTLASTLMGDPTYEIENGEIIYDGQVINDIKVEERARKGIFLAFQQPEEIDGVTVKNFIKTAKGEREQEPIKILKFHQELKNTLNTLNFDETYADRFLNLGFSGGEKKKSEILQMLMLNPKLAILDEIDSGLDVDAIKTVAHAVKNYHNEENAILIITHNAKLLEILKPDYVHVLMNGKIVKTGNDELMKEIEAHGFDSFRKEGE